MNRRSFLKMMFGGLAAAVVAPAIVKEIAFPSPLKIRAPRIYDLPFSFVQDFDLGQDSSILMRVPDDLIMRSFGVWYQPEVMLAKLKAALDTTYVEMRQDDELVFSVPAWMVGASPSLQGGRDLYPELRIEKNLLIDMHGQPGVDLSGVRGQMVIHGVRRFRD